jgi:AraC-like DNA-binding protein
VSESDTYREWEPPPAWRKVVACCWEQHVVRGRVQRVLPDGYADVLLHESGQVEVVEVVGLYDEVALPVLPAGTHLRGVRLRPAAVASALRTTAASLRNQTVPADDVLGSRVARELLDERHLDAWVREIEPHDRASAAVQLLASHSVSDAADGVGVSPRQLRRILLNEVGLTPKAYQRVIRLQRFLRGAKQGIGLAAAAASAGYADQPHLTREVHELSGLTPAQLLAERNAT